MRRPDEGTGGRVAALDAPAPNYTDDAGSDWLVRPALVSESRRVKRLLLISPGIHDVEPRFMTTEEAWADWTAADEVRAEKELDRQQDEREQRMFDSREFDQNWER